MASARCPNCRVKDFSRARCPACGYSEAAAIASYDKIPFSVTVAKVFRRPLAPSYRANMPWKWPMVAAVLGAAVIGSGHMYTEKWLQGMGYLVLAIVLTWSISNVSLWALFFLAVIWQWQIVDAYDHAVEYDWESIFQAEAKEG